MEEEEAVDIIVQSSEVEVGEGWRYQSEVARLELKEAAKRRSGKVWRMDQSGGV